MVLVNVRIESLTFHSSERGLTIYIDVCVSFSNSILSKFRGTRFLTYLNNIMIFSFIMKLQSLKQFLPKSFILLTP